MLVSGLESKWAWYLSTALMINLYSFYSNQHMIELHVDGMIIIVIVDNGGVCT